MGRPLHLEPALGDRLLSLLRTPGLLHLLTGALGSPLNVLVPDQIAENLARFRSVYRRHRLSGQIFLAHKANRSSALLRRLAATDAGVDVASLGELRHALGAGFGPDRIMATGPKNPEFLWLAARAGVTVGVDSAGELDRLAALVGRHSLARARVLLRLSGFEAPGVRVLSRRSRFGSPVRDLDTLLERLEQHAGAVELTGVAYHLDTTSLSEKATALESCLTALETCRSRGLRPRALDIGGGFGVSYLADRRQWEEYTTQLTEAVLGRRPPLAWQGHGYGLRNEAGTLRGTLGLYPAHRPVAGERYLDELLARPAASFGGRPLAALLLEHLYDLYIEPGRALVDQCGITLAKVLEVRQAGADGAAAVRLAMKADDMALEKHGVLMDPVVVPRDGSGPRDAAGPVAVHLFGSLCLESDLVTRRTVFLPCRPEPGDLLAFANTAGYAMDFHAGRAQHQPVARKVAAWQDGGTWRWCLDEEYWPTMSAEGPQ
ncbi:Y4yA family PLP-dependent enzyme [Streptomyces aidingensis]|uniref:Diaminopimelate decarboxylase n=1 Tax=Streptomyces aidingensis TaxID=910347 RepID=A0A1I1N4W8_9ACTN|nr:Y4yA family PLP-dependent enzyme [Streptomyces aidingensis]SFC92707.1 diaminopimelate decarboxylase [Streptomyces aidingensis]